MNRKIHETLLREALNQHHRLLSPLAAGIAGPADHDDLIATT